MIDWSQQTREFITTRDGCRLAYRYDGPEDAPVVMLGHSLGCSLEMWAPQIAGLAVRYRVLRYDLRGHGQSDAPLGAYSLDRLGRDVVELLEALDIDRVHFCGLSLGGMIGQWLGARAPDRLASLALCNTSAFMGPPADWDARITTVSANGTAAVAEAVTQRWFTPHFLTDHPNRVAPVRAMIEATSGGGYAGCSAAIRDMDLRPTAPLIVARTLIIAGKHDPATPPAHAQFLHDGIPGASLVMLDGAHLSNVECGTAFVTALLSFLGNSGEEL